MSRAILLRLDGTKRTRGWKTGERHHNAKVSDEVVRQMRMLRNRTGLSFAKIGRQFGVSEWTVRDICELRTRPL